MQTPLITDLMPPTTPSNPPWRSMQRQDGTSRSSFATRASASEKETRRPRDAWHCYSACWIAPAYRPQLSCFLSPTSLHPLTCWRDHGPSLAWSYLARYLTMTSVSLGRRDGRGIQAAMMPGSLTRKRKLTGRASGAHYTPPKRRIVLAHGCRSR